MTWIRRFSHQVSASRWDASSSSSAPIQKYTELSHLPKAPAIRSIRFKRTNPGSVSHLNFGPESTPVLDPTHPLARARPQQLLRIVPHYRCALFEAHAYPHAVLRKFAFPDLMIQLKDRGVSNEFSKLVSRRPNAQTQQTRRDPGPEKAVPTPVEAEAYSVGDRRRAAHTLPMSLMIITPKKPLHKSGFIRTTIKRRVREALNLVVIRGASPQNGPQQSITLRTPEGLHRDDIETSCILQGWIYVIRPSLEVYRCPWPLLLQHLREALLKIQPLAKKLEAEWAEGSHQKAQRVSNPRNASSRQNRGNSQRSNANSNLRQPQDSTGSVHTRGPKTNKGSQAIP